MSTKTGSKRFWIAVAVFLNVVCLVTSYTSWNRRETHDYIGQDFPVNNPAKVGKVETLFDDDVRFPFSLNVSHGMWTTRFPNGAGYIVQGPDSRAFYTAMWHELHCLRVIYNLLDAPDDPLWGGEEHLQHCLNYLRQYVLCNADDTLEPGDYQEEPASFTRQCNDWNGMFEFSNRNYDSFLKDQIRKAREGLA